MVAAFNFFVRLFLVLRLLVRLDFKVVLGVLLFLRVVVTLVAFFFLKVALRVVPVLLLFTGILLAAASFLSFFLSLPRAKSAIRKTRETRKTTETIKIINTTICEPWGC